MTEPRTPYHPQAADFRPVLGNTRRADIVFHRSGRIDITSRVVRLLNLAPGDAIDIAVCGAEYYLYVTSRAAQALPGTHRAVCHRSSRYGRHSRAWSRPLARFVLDACGGGRIAALPVGESLTVPTLGTVVALITRHNLANPSQP